MDSYEKALKAIEVLVDSDFAESLEGWGLDGNGEMIPVAERKCDVKLLATAQRVIGDIYCIVHSEVSNCTNPHLEWKARKDEILIDNK